MCFKKLSSIIEYLCFKKLSPIIELSSMFLKTFFYNRIIYVFKKLFSSITFLVINLNILSYEFDI